MPTDAAITVAVITALFAAFAGLLIFADMTWDKPRK